jgi:Ser-tRNA(Ala) deacylase AlaX
MGNGNKDKAAKIRLRKFHTAKLLRMDILSKLYKRGYSYREMRSEVMARLDLQTYSLETLKKDIDSLLEEWRETRIEDLDLALQLELERIDNLVKEAWEAWDRSKESYKKVKGTQEGIPGTPDGEGDGQVGEIITTKMKQTSEDVVSYGDPRYLEVINRLLMERRKLLGLYSPEKMDVSGDMSFYAMLMQTGKE